jgi:hypothetical protein
MQQGQRQLVGEAESAQRTGVPASGAAIAPMAKMEATVRATEVKRIVVDRVV